jgi:P-type Cu2+ transporter
LFLFLFLATPAAISAAISALNRQKILVLNTNVLEKLTKLKHVVMDKTGTLTTGKFKCVQFDYLPDVVPLIKIWQYVETMASSSMHPLSKSLAIEAKKQLKNRNDIHEVAYVDYILKHTNGAGIKLEVADKNGKKASWYMGSQAFIASSLAISYEALSLNLSFRHSVMVEDVDLQLCSCVYLANDEGLQAIFWLMDELRMGAIDWVKYCKAKGYELHILSGDKSNVVSYWANYLDIKHAYASMLPDQKMEYVRALQAKGGVTMMVGDGMNDAPVLACADISVSFAEASALAQSGSDLLLMDTSLDALKKLLFVSGTVSRIIVQNLIWAFLYNLISIPLAILGYMTPLWAGVGMSLSSLIVVLNALRASFIPK